MRRLYHPVATAVVLSFSFSVAPAEAESLSSSSRRCNSNCISRHEGWRQARGESKTKQRLQRMRAARRVALVRAGGDRGVPPTSSSASEDGVEVNGHTRGKDRGADGAGRKGGGDADTAAGWLDGDDSLAALGTASRSQLLLRGCFLVLVFFIPFITSGLAYLSSWFREKFWFRALTRSIALSGTAFIKWGQWSSTRPDMFPEELCKVLSVLHKGAPSHKYWYTKKLVERAYGGRRINQIFDWFEEKPLASGSIAQIHKAVLHGQIVAVKVRHPEVKQRIFMDFIIMRKIAELADATPSLKWMNLGPSMEQFSHTMAAQTNLLLEAANLDNFNWNFRGWADCLFPVVLHRTEDVLVETFEEGSVVSDYAKLFNKKPNGNPGLWEWAQMKMLGRSPNKDTEAQERADPVMGHFIVTRGEDMWLKMVLNDGLLHADLHPGNILIHAPQNGPPRLVLVDAGMVAKLYGDQRRHFIRLLECLGSGDGVGAARAVLNFSAKQTCVEEEEQGAFCRDMDAVFREKCQGYHTTLPPSDDAGVRQTRVITLRRQPTVWDVDVGDVLRGVLTCVRRHSVRVDVEYATLILNILCLDSIGKALLPSYNILDGAQPLLELHKLGSRVIGHGGIKFILPLARAVKGRQDRRFLRRLMHELSKDENRSRNETQQERQPDHAAVVAADSSSHLYRISSPPASAAAAGTMSTFESVRDFKVVQSSAYAAEQDNDTLNAGPLQVDSGRSEGSLDRLGEPLERDAGDNVKPSLRLPGRNDPRGSGEVALTSSMPAALREDDAFVDEDVVDATLQDIDRST